MISAAVRRRVLTNFVSLEADEEEPLASAFAAFFCILASFYLLVPLRDEAGIALGTAALPSLFTASLVLTLIAAPIVGTAVNRDGRSREAAVQKLFRWLAVSLLAFCILYLVAARLGGKPQQSRPATAAALATERRTLSFAAQRSPEHAGMAASAGRSLLQGWAGGGDATLTTPQKGVRAALFLWVSLINLLAVSTMWAVAADTFSSDAGVRLFGFLGAGATLGQLFGSLAATVAGRLASARVGGDAAASAMQLSLLLGAAALMETAGRLAGGVKRPAVTDRKSRSPERARAEEGRATVKDAPSRSKHAAMPAASAVRRLDSFRLIVASPYLRHLCAFLTLNYVVSSFFYFERSLVVAAAANDSVGRTRLFAAMNSASGAIIAVLQLVLTGRMLGRLGLPVSLAALPLAAAAMLLVIAAAPTAAAVACAEVVRKVVNYALTRPAREVLFTVVSRDERYRAKLVIDTAVQRFGDALAAALFQVLQGFDGMSPSRVAMAAVPVCAAWSVVAYSLGRRQQVLEHKAAARL